MPRPGITKDQVWQAAEALEREGANPTVLRVRAKLGSGSPNTITPYLAEWRKRRQAPAPSVERPGAPNAVTAAVCQLWEAALSEAGARLQSERSSLATAREDLEHERAEALAEVERLGVCARSLPLVVVEARSEPTWPTCAANVDLKAGHKLDRSEGTYPHMPRGRCFEDECIRIR